MFAKTLKIAFLWHMHQPYYFDPITKKFKMPWVRLHCVKDYLDMLLNVERYEKIHPVFNFTPSLIDQIELYLNGTPELHVELTLKNPDDLTPYEKALILKDFFMANWDTMIKPFSRFYELLIKRGNPKTQEEFIEASRFFTKQDFLDLQVLFNLTWVDPIFRQEDPFLKELVKKGRYFTQNEKELLIEKHYEIMGKIVPAYKKCFENNHIEISISPFCHPILPLLIDNYIAKISEPNTVLPSLRFQYPQDAFGQIVTAINFSESRFGKKIMGMWPSEGSVSDEALKLISKAGIKWTATDEGVLSKTLNLNTLPAEKLYRSYRYQTESGPLYLFFRDHRISDNIGFVYSRMTAEDATNHLLRTLHNIKTHLDNTSPRQDYIVPIILDGENAWEFYPNDGNDFLNLLYQRLEKDEAIEVVTFSEFINTFPQGEQISHIHPGSWINSNFKIWIGHQEDNTAWELLTEVRQIFEEQENSLDQGDIVELRKSLYIAEGSDWCWWYGDEHSTEFDLEFDELFRAYIKDIYKKLNLPTPTKLDIPIVRKEKEVKPDKEMLNFITPKIDGKVTSYFEWLGSYSYNLKKFGFAMHRTHVYFENLSIGFDLQNLYLRLDPEIQFLKNKELFPITMTIRCNDKMVIFGTVDESGLTNFSLTKENRNYTLEAAFQKVLELKIPLEYLNLKEGDTLFFNIYIELKDHESITFPPRGTIKVVVPTKNFEELYWHA